MRSKIIFIIRRQKKLILHVNTGGMMLILTTPGWGGGWKSDFSKDDELPVVFLKSEHLLIDVTENQEEIHGEVHWSTARSSGMCLRLVGEIGNQDLAQSEWFWWWILVVIWFRWLSNSKNYNSWWDKRHYWMVEFVKTWGHKFALPCPEM
jgi:hypothetical protein